jgi:hypothetical protein
VAQTVKVDRKKLMQLGPGAPSTASFEVAHFRPIGNPTDPASVEIRFDNYAQQPKNSARSALAAPPPPTAAVERRGRIGRARA